MSLKQETFFQFYFIKLIELVNWTYILYLLAKYQGKISSEKRGKWFSHFRRKSWCRKISNGLLATIFDFLFFFFFFFFAVFGSFGVLTSDSNLWKMSTHWHIYNDENAPQNRGTYPYTNRVRPRCVYNTNICKQKLIHMYMVHRIKASQLDTFCHRP